MSWILGYVGTSLSHEQRERLTAVAPDPLVEFAANTFYVTAGGLPETCFGGSLPGEQGQWCVVGTGVRLDDDRTTLLTSSDWLRLLLPERPRFENLGGGFVALRTTSGRVEAFNDVFGLRSFYWLRSGNGHFFSTRPEWLAALGGGLHIDWPAFGSHWLTYNQLSAHSLVRGLERLGPRGCVTLTDAESRTESHPYALPHAHQNRDVRDLVRMLLEPADARTVSLGLSGGIDSRTLLALRSRGERFAVHVFGPKSKADVRIAVRIAEEENISFSYFSVPPPDLDTLIDIVRGHAVQTQALSPASSALSLRYYRELRSQQKIVVDGAFGEILRRQFMNRLLRRGSNALKNRDADRALEHIRFERAPIFREDVSRDMEGGARRDLAVCLNDLPEVKKRHDIENAVDLLNVRTRLPNFFGYEQARLDGLVQNFMPFAHPLVIDAVFRLPSARRRSGRISRRIIARRAPRLRRYPLVKAGIEYPYALPPIAAPLWIMMNKKIGTPADPADRTAMLDTLKEFILDRIHSANVQQHPAYDRLTLNRIAETYYKSGEAGARLDWWLAFDLWREAVELPAGAGTKITR